MRDKDSNSPLFTVLMEFDGTTSASQVNAKDEIQALRLWASRLLESGCYGLSETAARQLQTALATEELERVAGLSNVWCTTAVTGGRLALFHIVRTLSAPQ